MRVSVLGGDKRMLYCAKAFEKDGYDITLSGFDRLQSDCGIRITDPYSAVITADIIVLPLFPLAGEYLNMPFSKEKVRFESFERLAGERTVFCGMSDMLPKNTLDLFDYSKREDYLIRNAYLTAEGAVYCAMTESFHSLKGAKILILGYGRIAKLLSEILLALHADVTVAARKASDRAWIGERGMKATDFSFKEYYEYDVIFNTVPALVLDQNALDHISDNALIIDLASKSGGVDYAYAKERGILALHMLSLPAKYAPETAGEIIEETIMNILEEA